MKCRNRNRILLSSFIIVLWSFISNSCKESLPTHIPPQHVVDIKVSDVEQYNDHQAPPGRQRMHFVIIGENIFDEVFWDSVNIKGSVRIWWKRKPARFRTIYLTDNNMTDRTLIHNGRMMLLPGQRFSMDVYWDIRSDNGKYLPLEMDFARARSRQCTYNVLCGSPEDFVIEVSLNVYNRLGYLIAPPKEFTFRPRVCNCANYPPCGPGGGEC
jgi:hypothetical protein